MKTWNCGHKTGDAYSHWPECPVCALESGRYTEIKSRLENKARIEADRNMKEGILWSQTFNRSGCPYCGGIF